MISPELSTIQRNKERSAALEAEVAEFLKRGGVIGTVQVPAYKPRPYGRMVLAAPPGPHRRTRQAIQDAMPIPPPPDERERLLEEQAAIAQELATTMTITEVGRRTGLSRHMLRKFATDRGFDYQPFDPSPNLKHVQTERINPIADAMNVLRIEDARDRGLSRKAAKDLIGISNTLMERLIADYSIDYPPKRIHRK